MSWDGGAGKRPDLFVAGCEREPGGVEPPAGVDRIRAEVLSRARNRDRSRDPLRLGRSRQALRRHHRRALARARRARRARQGRDAGRIRVQPVCAFTERRPGADAADARDGAALRRKGPVRSARERARRRRVSAAAARSLREQRTARAGGLQRRPGRGRQVRPERAAVQRDAQLRQADQPDDAGQRHDHAAGCDARQLDLQGHGSDRRADRRPLYRQEANQRRGRSRRLALSAGPP